MGEIIMINILIADDNLYYAKTLMDYVNTIYSNIKICSIAIDGKELLDILNSCKNIDIILLDMNMPIYNGLQVLKMLSKEARVKYKKSFIIISGSSAIDGINPDNSSLIYNVLSKKQDMSNIINEIKKLIEYKHNQNAPLIRQKILKEISYLGYNTSYKGTKYLIDAIYYTIINNNMNIDNLNKDVYPLLAIKYKQPIHNIKCNINRATVSMYYNCNSDRLRKYFSFYEDEKPNTKTIIFTIINKII